jgi:phosphoribosylamine--glycine ligase
MPRYLVLGSGGREHAIAWKLACEADAEVIVAPGNDGIAATPNCRTADVDLDDHDAVVALAREHGVDVTIVGPEAPLCAGIADRFATEELPLFGPTADAARLEGSKSFAKEVMNAAGVPTADYAFFDTLDGALAHVEEATHPLVIKADGLAGGKGVVISEDVATSRETLKSFVRDEKFGESSTSVVIEEFLQGPEMSFMVVTDGERIVPLSTSQDHKRVGEDDTGPNTGGMGAITPSPHATPELRQTILDEVIAPTLDELKHRGIVYRGFLYAGLMLTAAGPRVLEFNVRLGDPETQALLFSMTEPLGPVLSDAARGNLSSETTLESSLAACCVVLASRGYPLSSQKGDRIQGLDETGSDDVYVFHAGTAGEPGKWSTAGGRVLGVTGRADDLDTARRRAYQAVAGIDWDGMHYRRDIGGEPID